MQKQKHRQNEQLIVKVTKQEKNLLAKMGMEQNIKVEKLVRELIFSSGLINY